MHAIDSLNRVITVAKNDTQVAEAYLAWGEELYQVNLDTAGILWEKARVLAVEGRNNPNTNEVDKKAFARILGNTLNDLGYFYGMRGDREKALDISEQSLELRRMVGNRQGEAMALANIGAIHVRSGRIELGLDYYRQALDIRIELDLKKDIANSYHNIGSAYNNLGDAEKAINNYHKALAIREEIEDSVGIASSLNNIGYVHIVQEDTALGLDYYKRAYEMNVSIGNQRGIVLGLANMGAEYCNRGLYEKCLDCYRESVKISLETHNWRSLGTTYNNIGNLYENKGPLDSALAYYFKSYEVQQRVAEPIGLIYSQINIAAVYLAMNELGEAERFALQAIEQAHQVRNPEGRKRCEQVLSEIYEAKGESAKALEYYRLFVATRDSLLNESNQKASFRQEMQYAYQKQAVADSVNLAREKALGEARAKASEAALDEERLWTNSLIVGSVLLVIILGLTIVAIISQKRSQRELKAQRDDISKSEKEKELLLREIHHRVKNNLQIITGLLELQSVEMDDERFASAIVEGQNRVKSMALIHQKLYQVNELATINIEDYVESLIRELEVVFRSKKSVQHLVYCSGIVLDIDTAIPLGLMLNELVSNSYKHAVSYAEKPEIGIKIAQVAAGEYSLIYYDNGPGLPADFSFKSTTLGMRLVKRLAQQLFGSVDIDQDHVGTKFDIRFKDNSFRNQID